MIWDYLNASLTRAFQAAGYAGVEATVQRSRRPDVGEFQCTTAMSLAKTLRQPPAAIASAVAEHLSADDFERISVDGPGFINLKLSGDLLAQRTADLRDDPRHGAPRPEPQKLILDFGGPNVAKRMHVGHLRSSIIGDSLQRLARFLGHDVVSDVHLGDWGLPMGMLIAEIRERWPELPYFTDGFDPAAPVDDGLTVEVLNELYPEAARRCAADPQMLERAKDATARLQAGDPALRALWRRMVDVSVAAVRADFDLLGVSFDRWDGESDVHDVLQAMIGRLRGTGVAQESEGALIVPVSGPDDQEPVPPLMLVKGDGGVTYGATDLATIEHRVRHDAPGAVWYVVDQRQRLHFVQVFRAAEAAGVVRGGEPALEHVGFGTVNGPDGKPFKTRAGEVMTLRDLIELTIGEAAKRVGEMELAAGIGADERATIARQIGLAAIKFADLRNFRQSDYVFDLAQFCSFEGRTGPYLCYSVVRARSLLAKAADRGLEGGALGVPRTPEERDVYLRLLDFGRAAAAAYERRAPNVLADHAYDLAQSFNAFYHSGHILSEEDVERRGSQLALTRTVCDQLVLVLSLLGIEVPQWM
jgi:arginyl-tRNA synthetase